MKIFWANIEVNFFYAIDIIDKNDDALPEKAVGFFQEIGCTCEDEAKLKQIITDYLKEQRWMNFSKSDVLFDRIGEISPNDLSSEIYDDPEIRDALLANPKKEGLWYLSGKAFFFNNDGEEIYEARIIENDNEASGEDGAGR